jgi:hypothetical protein
LGGSAGVPIRLASDNAVWSGRDFRRVWAKVTARPPRRRWMVTSQSATRTEKICTRHSVGGLNQAWLVSTEWIRSVAARQTEACPASWLPTFATGMVVVENLTACLESENPPIKEIFNGEHFGW